MNAGLPKITITEEEEEEGGEVLELVNWIWR